MKARIPEDKIKLIESMYKENKPHDEIKQATGVSLATISRYVRKLNFVNNPTHTIELTPKQVKLLTRGQTIKKDIYIIKQKDVNIKELYEQAKKEIYNLRYQLKKARN